MNRQRSPLNSINDDVRRPATISSRVSRSRRESPRWACLLNCPTAARIRRASRRAAAGLSRATYSRISTRLPIAVTDQNIRIPAVRVLAKPFRASRPMIVASERPCHARLRDSPAHPSFPCGQSRAAIPDLAHTSAAPALRATNGFALSRPPVVPAASANPLAPVPPSSSQP
jgi:hypothetical protein